MVNPFKKAHPSSVAVTDEGGNIIRVVRVSEWDQVLLILARIRATGADVRVYVDGELLLGKGQK